MRYLSVCSGIEAATSAWHSLGWQPVGFAEIEPFPSKVLAHHYGSNMPGEALSRNGVPNFGDFTAIETAALGDVDVLVGGTPCQAFSVAGKRLSLSDARGNLSLAYAVLAHELARSHGLRWAVWENVPGVLSTDDNAFGCLLAALVGGDDALCLPRGIERWPDEGMVEGPRARAAWRIFDAQYFGLAQRRRRVFVVVGFGEGADPAAVLFERAGVRRHPPTRGEAGAGITVGTLAGTSSGGGWRVGADEAAAGQLIAGTLGHNGKAAGSATNQDAHSGLLVPVAYGGNNTRVPIDVATALNAHGGPCGRQDFESETFVVAPPLTGNPYGDHEAREGLLVAHTLRGEGFDASEDGTGRGTPIVPVTIAFAQNSRDEVRLQGGDGEIVGALAAEPGMKQTTYVAFTCKDHGSDAGEIAPTMRAMGHGETHANGGGQLAVAFGIRSDAMREGTAKTPSADAAGIVRLRDPGLGITEELAPTIDCGAAHAVATTWAVRRLTPQECEILQGFPPGHTAIPGAADGPRYKALGNSFAVPVVRWIGERIQAQEVSRV